MQTNSWLPLFLRALLRVSYPAICAKCDEPLRLNESVLCRACLQNLILLQPPVCKTCARPLPPFINNAGRCRECRRSRHEITRLYAVVPYDETHRALLHEIKFQKRRWILGAYHALIKRTLEKRNVARPDFIVPVPLDGIRKRRREFNQAEDLAQIISGHLNCPLLRNAVGRRLSRPAQSTLSRRERLMNVRGQFYIKQSRKIKDRSILLVDDVYTTGATLNECANVLRQAGAGDINAFVLARAL